MTHGLPQQSIQDLARPAVRLSERQRDCLRLAAQGLASREIGRRLALSPRTVDDHILFACRLLGVRTRIQAVALLARSERPSGQGRSFLP